MFRFYMILKAYFICISINVVYAHIPTQQETVIYRSHLDAFIVPKCLSLPEGGFAYYYHPTVRICLQQPLNTELLKSIEAQLTTSLKIPFTKEGFTQAVARPEGDQFGEVSYSAIWVRDCCWHYYGFRKVLIKKTLLY